MYEILENAFHTIVMYSCLLLEGIGIAIILYMAIRSLVLLIRGRKGVGMGLAKGIAWRWNFCWAARCCIRSSPKTSSSCWWWASSSCCA